MKYLGIDYGKKKVGLAISEGMLAAPYQVISVSSLKDALNKIGSVIKKEGIDQVIVGLPDSGEAYKMAKNFIKVLGQEISVKAIDETLSTKQAIVAGSKHEDSTAAAIILQNYLDEKP